MPPDTNTPSRQDEAARWFAAERAGAMLIEQKAEFEAWKQDPRNMAALEAMRELWDDLAILKGQEPAPRSAARPRQALAIAAALFVVAVGGLTGVLMLGHGGATIIATAIGQQETQSMPDGSLIAVNVASNVSYRVTEDERVVTLSEGEAAFTVRPDAAKPFVVRTGDWEIRAVGTTFNVRQRDGAANVAVSEGTVEVCRVTGSGREVVAVLNAGQLLALGADMERQLSAPVPVRPDQVAEWRMRVVTYEDASVEEVVEDFNRYFERKLTVEQQELLSRRVTIRLRVDDRERAIETLAGLLGARVFRSDQRDRLAV